MFGSQLPGVLAMFAALLILVALPWLDRSKVKSIRYRSWPYKVALTIFVISFIVLGWLGMQPVTPLFSLMAQIFTALYFAFFILMPWFTSVGKTKPVPERTTEH
jgi:ubiquinol-cytochrome c reductase cytochrome b subunit